MEFRIVKDALDQRHFAAPGEKVTYCGEPVAADVGVWRPGERFDLGFCPSCAYINQTWLEAGAWEGAGDPPGNQEGR